MSEEIIKNEKENKIPWYPLENEPMKEYGAFECYLSIGESRSYQKTADIMKLSLKTIYRYAKQWDWRLRANVHDLVHAELRRNDILLEIEKSNEELFKTKTDISYFAAHALKETAYMLRDFWAHFDNPVSVTKLNFLAKVARTLDKLQGLSEMPMFAELYKDKSKRDVNLNCILNLDGNMEELKRESYFAYSNIMDEKELLRTPNLKKNSNDYPMQVSHKNMAQSGEPGLPALNEILKKYDK